MDKKTGNINSYKSQFKTAFFISIITLILVEVFLRFVLGNLAIAKLYTLNTSDGRCVALKPNAKVKYTGWFWKIKPVILDVNSYGFRGLERAKIKPKGVIRIVTLGDSYTYGQGVKYNETFSYYLEKILIKKTKKRIEVLNFGVPGYNIDESLKNFYYFASKWKPDIVLFFIFSDDLSSPLCSFTKKKITAYLLRNWYLFRLIYILFRPNIIQKTNDEKLNEKVLYSKLKKLANLTRKKTTKLVIIILENPLSNKEKNALKKIMEKLKISHLDGQKWNIKKIKGEGHFKPSGNYQVALYVAEYLLKIKLLFKR
jgi:lysophospholipase L1-like esterase